MNYKPEIGKIYDTVFYCIYYFNKAAVNDNILFGLTEPEFIESCYHDIEIAFPALPQIYYPLFICHNQRHTPMSDFFTDKIDFVNDTIDTFLDKIVKDSDRLYSKIVDSVFPNELQMNNIVVCPQNNSKSYIEALSTSNYSDNFKLQVSLLFGNYHYVITTLVEQLQLIYTHIDLLHKKHSSRIMAEAEQIQSAKNIHLYKSVLNLDLSNTNNSCLFSISLLNPYTTQSFISQKITELLFGIKHEEDLTLQYDERNINLHQLLTALGNDTRLAIIQTLMEKEELTASAITKITNLPSTTILRHIDMLYSYGVLYISKRCGMQIFYRINYDLLKKANELIRRKLNEAEAQNTPNEG